MARLTLRVQPRAKTTRFDGRLGEAHRLRLAAPPVDGKANDACTRFLADFFGVPVSQVRIISGSSSRTKLVEIAGIDDQTVSRMLEGVEKHNES